MKKIFLYGALILGSAIILFFTAESFTGKFGKFINNSSHPLQQTTKKKGYILTNLDFSGGEYALYIRHKKYGEFMVLDKEGLSSNQNRLKVKLSWITYLPGEGDRNYGVMLFKDNKLIARETAGAFKYFNIGSLKDYALPVEWKRHSVVKEIILEKLNYIKNNKQAFFTSKPDLLPDNRSYKFRIYFPSIAIPATTRWENGVSRVLSVKGIDHHTWTMKEEVPFEKEWAAKLEKCIRRKAGNISDFEVSTYGDASSFPYLFSDDVDLGTKEGKTLYVYDYIFYNFQAYISAGKADADKLLALDYSDCISAEDRKRPQIIAVMKKLIEQSNQPDLDIDAGQVGLSGYRDETSKYKKVYRQEYNISWLEIKDKP